MKKRAFIEIHGLVEIILVLVVILALLSITGYYKIILNRFGEDTLCQGSFVASAMTKMFGQTTIDPKCRTNRITLVMEVEDEGITETGGEKMALNKDYPSNDPSQAWDTKVRVDDWNDKFSEDFPYPYTKEYPTGLSDEKKDEYVTVRYNMDKIFAEELKRCWTVVGKGNLPLFDNWFRFIDCSDDPGFQECKHVIDAMIAVVGIDGKVKPTANFCVLCSRIKYDFDEDAKKDYIGEFNSIDNWMNNNPWQVGRRTSYREYLMEEDESYFAAPTFTYSTTEPQAIVFIRINFHEVPLSILRSVDVADDILSVLSFYDKIEDDEKFVYYANALRVFPYKDLPNQCDYIVGSYI